MSVDYTKNKYKIANMKKIKVVYTERNKIASVKTNENCQYWKN